MAENVQVDDMPAGREMDALVAEKVMGKTVFWRKVLESYSWDHEKKKADTPNYEQVPVEDLGGAAVAYWDVGCEYQYKLPIIKHYSANIAAAWEVVEKMRLTGREGYWRYGVEITMFPSLVEVRLWTHGFGVGKKGAQVTRAETAPLAICRAALKAVGVTEV